MLGSIVRGVASIQFLLVKMTAATLRILTLVSRIRACRQATQFGVHSFQQTGREGINFLLIGVRTQTAFRAPPVYV